ncbi:hypothetical protein AMATHDRAFT_84823 [Amanita thiersii Skay4041]|uniref:RING-type E3 ubiquitin transferase n=1 Tax=Amanita thiersii Skay4041 TaxID=703135 RepID=A0A2A9NRE9_9AGAR|nr:hypothetical protein AMATHDRAFT_84823 [Amanita thiersii Skay4041]
MAPSSPSSSSPGSPFTQLLTRRQGRHSVAFLTRLDRSSVYTKRLRFLKGLSISSTISLFLTWLIASSLTHDLAANVTPAFRTSMRLTQNILIAWAIFIVLTSTVLPFFLGECRLRLKYGFRPTEINISRLAQKKAPVTYSLNSRYWRTLMLRNINPRFAFYNLGSFLSEHFWMLDYGTIVEAYQLIATNKADESQFEFALWYQHHDVWTSYKAWAMHNLAPSTDEINTFKKFLSEEGKPTLFGQWQSILHREKDSADAYRTIVHLFAQEGMDYEQVWSMAYDIDIASSLCDIHCSMLHVLEYLMSKPICLFYVKNVCHRSPCPFRHELKAQRTALSTSHIVCNHHKKGHCAFGDHCLYSHQDKGGLIDRSPRPNQDKKHFDDNPQRLDFLENTQDSPRMSPQNNARPILKQNSSTSSPCAFYQLGNCQRGDACALSVEGRTSMATSPLIPSQLPKHNPSASAEAKKRKSCRFFQQGRCKFGKGCRDLHTSCAKGAISAATSPFLTGPASSSTIVESQVGEFDETLSTSKEEPSLHVSPPAANAISDSGIKLNIWTSDSPKRHSTDFCEDSSDKPLTSLSVSPGTDVHQSGGSEHEIRLDLDIPFTQSDSSPIEGQEPSIGDNQNNDKQVSVTSSDSNNDALSEEQIDDKRVLDQVHNSSPWNTESANSSNGITTISLAEEPEKANQGNSSFDTVTPENCVNPEEQPVSLDAQSSEGSPFRSFVSPSYVEGNVSSLAGTMQQTEWRELGHDENSYHASAQNETYNLDAVTDQDLTDECFEPEQNINIQLPHWTDYADPMVNPFVPFCRFYAKGQCARGFLCAYRHSLTLQEYFLLFRTEPHAWTPYVGQVPMPLIFSNQATLTGGCKFYPLGTCRNGDKCPYPHIDPPESGDLKDTATNDQDELEGNDVGVEVHESTSMRKPCRWFTKNKFCKLGDDCPFSHEESNESSRSNGLDTETPEPQTMDTVGTSASWEREDFTRNKGSEYGRGRRICKWYTDGTCRRGDAYRSVHEQRDEDWSINDNLGGWDDGTGEPQAENKTEEAATWGLQDADCGTGIATDTSDTSANNNEGQYNEWGPQDNGWGASWDNPGTSKTDNWNEPESKNDGWGTSWGDQGTSKAEGWKGPEKNGGWGRSQGTSREARQWNSASRDTKRKREKICWDYTRGRCSRTLCIFLHQAEETQNENELNNDAWNNGDDHDAQSGAWTSTQIDTANDKAGDECQPSWGGNAASWDSWSEANNEPTDPVIHRKKPCKSFGQGFCGRGDSCPMLHINPDAFIEDEGEEINEKDDTNNNGEQHDNGPTERVIYRCIVHFGTGCRVQNLVTETDSNCLLITGIPTDITLEGLTNLLPFTEGMDNLELDNTRGPMVVYLKYTTKIHASLALKILTGFELHGSVLSVHYYDLPNGQDADEIQNRKVRVTWPSPTRSAWARYSSVSLAKEDANRLDGQIIGGYKIKASYLPSKRGQSSLFTVQLSNLPVGEDEASIKQRCKGCQMVNMTKPTYTESPVELIRAMLDEHGELAYFDSLDVAAPEESRYAFAEFYQLSSAVSAVTTAVKDTFTFLGDFKVQSVFLMRFHLRFDHFQCIQDDLKRLKSNDERRCTITVVYNHQMSVTIYVHALPGDRSTYLKTAKAVSSLVQGEVLQQDDSVVWDEYFCTLSSIKAVEKLNAENADYHTLIVPDPRTQRILLFGQEMNRPHARSSVLKLLKKVRAAWHEVPFERIFVRWYLEQGLSKIHEDPEIGHNKVSLDLTTPKLIVKGESKVLKKVKDHTSNAFTTIGRETQYENNTNICPVCLHNPISPVRLPCNHCYCKGCLRLLLNTPGNHTLASHKCIATVIDEQDRQQCNSEFSNTIIGDILNADDEEHLLKQSLLSYTAKAREDSLLPTMLERDLPPLPDLFPSWDNVSAVDEW